MTCATTALGHTDLARCRLVDPGGGGVWSGRWLQGDGLAEGLELPDQAVDLPGGVDASFVEVRAEIVEAGRRVGQQMADDHEDGPGDGAESLGLAPASDQAPVAFRQARAV